MSGVFEEKKAARAYFSQERDFCRKLAYYDFGKGVLVAPKEEEPFSREWQSGGVPLFVSGNGVYVDKTDLHTLVIGPTGSKKSRLVMMPIIRTLAIAQESMIVSDPKAEMFKECSSDLVSKGYRVAILNLRDPLVGESWNPFALPYKLYCEGDLDGAYGLVNDIANNLIHTSESEKDPFWDNSAGQLFYGLSLLLFKHCKEFGYSDNHVNMGNVIELCSILFNEDASGRPSSSPLWQYAKRDPFVANALRGSVMAPNETRGGILSVFNQKTQSFVAQPALLNMISTNTLDLSTLREIPTAVFLILPDEKTSHHNLASLFIKQSYEHVIKSSQNASEHGQRQLRLNYVLDEFSSLPTVSDFPAMITASRSRGIRFFLAIQSKHQLILRYREEAETVMTNCGNWIFLNSRELELLKELSALCGETKSDRPRPVLSVTDLQRFSRREGEALVLRDREKPFLARFADIKHYPSATGGLVSMTKRAPADDLILDFHEEKEMQRAISEEKHELLKKLMSGALDLNMDEILNEDSKTSLKPSVSATETEKTNGDGLKN